MVAEQLSHVARLPKKPGNTGQSSGKHRTNRQGYPPCWKTSHFEAGWWLSPTPLKNDGVKVSWDDDIPNCFWKVIKAMFQTNQ